MNLELFDFELPDRLIAQHPPAERSGGRLLHLAGPESVDLAVTDFPALLRRGDLVVFNDTRVVPARCVGRKRPGGGRIEILLERNLGGGDALVQIGTSKSIRDGQAFDIGDVRGEVLGRDGGFFRIHLEAADALDVFHDQGRVPLPPYIRRTDADIDRERYQTVYAERPGAVAAPTAGLHFDHALLEAIDAAGARRAVLTLHVGAGTFQPVRVERIEDHVMHAEHYFIDDELATAVSETRARGGRVVAVGTTVARALESAATEAGGVTAGEAQTRLFIFPGYRFRVVDALLTNFHLPRSTLLMMVCAFAGRDRVLAAYHHAIARGYRFFSYGDAMFTERVN